MKCAVRFPYGKKIHILSIHDKPLCGVEIPQNSVFYYDHLPPFTICNRCYEAIGREMLTEYLGSEVIASSNVRLNEGGKD